MVLLDGKKLEGFVGAKELRTLTFVISFCTLTFVIYHYHALPFNAHSLAHVGTSHISRMSQYRDF